jgi:hypothetical protein
MKKLVLLALLLSSCTQTPRATKVETAKPEATQFRAVVPKSVWEPVFFQAIDKRASAARLPSLRRALPKGDLELRLWNGFGLTQLQGFVLRRSSGQWSAIQLSVRSKPPRQEYEKQLAAPKSGWNECWSKLMEMGVLSLPDASEINCSAGVLDGLSYVVEINYENTYRTYLYDNPSYAECEQAKKMIEIGNTIAEEFNVPEMRTGDWPR